MNVSLLAAFVNQSECLVIGVNCADLSVCAYVCVCVSVCLHVYLCAYVCQSVAAFCYNVCVAEIKGNVKLAGSFHVEN